MLFFLVLTLKSCISLAPFSFCCRIDSSYLDASVLSLFVVSLQIVPIFSGSSEPSVCRYFLSVLPCYLFVMLLRYHSMICWISFSLSLGPQLPRITTMMGSMPGASQNTEACELMNWFSPQFLATLKYEMQGLLTVLFLSYICLTCRFPSLLMNLTSIVLLGVLRMSWKRGIFRHSEDSMAISEAEHLLSSFLRRGSASTYLIFSIFMVWQQLLTSSQNSAMWVLYIFSSASQTLQYSFFLFFSRQAPMLRAAMSSYSSPSSINSRQMRWSSVRISSTCRAEFLQNLTTVGVTMVWKREESILCLATRVLMVQKTSSLEKTDSSWGSWARQPRTYLAEQYSKMAHLGALTEMIFVGSRKLPEFWLSATLEMFLRDLDFQQCLISWNRLELLQSLRSFSTSCLNPSFSRLRTRFSEYFFIYIYYSGPQPIHPVLLIIVNPPSPNAPSAQAPLGPAPRAVTPRSEPASHRVQRLTGQLPCVPVHQPGQHQHRLNAGVLQAAHAVLLGQCGAGHPGQSALPVQYGQPETVGAELQHQGQSKDDEAFRMVVKRSLINCVSVVLYISSVKYIPIGVANALHNTSPIMAFFIEIFYYPQRRVHWVNLFIILGCFAGVVLIIQPGFLFGAQSADEGASFYYLMVLAAAFTSSFSMIFLHDLRDRCHELVVLHYAYMFQAFLNYFLLMLIPSPTGTKYSPIVEQMSLGLATRLVIYLCMVVLFAFFTTYFRTKSLFLCSPAVVMPFNYLNVVLGLVTDIAVFGAQYTWVTVLGMVLACCGLFMKIVLLFLRRKQTEKTIY